MAAKVPPDKIEKIVGVKRADYEHWGIARSKDQKTYILHSQACLDTNRVGYECIYTVAQDRGIELDKWEQDKAVQLRIDNGRLVPREANKPRKHLSRKK